KQLKSPLSNILGLFPSFGAGLTGGIQESAQLAWEGILYQNEVNGGTTNLICYGKIPITRNGNIIYTDSKLGALVETLRVRAKPSLVIVWHLGLLKLLPTLLRFSPKVVVFLHGVEAWRNQDLLTRYLL